MRSLILEDSFKRMFLHRSFLTPYLTPVQFFYYFMIKIYKRYTYTPKMFNKPVML